MCDTALPPLAIGPATRDALRRHGLRVDYMPDVYDGAHLAEGLADRMGTGDVLLFRAESGSPELTEVLRARGVPFRETALYRTRYVRGAPPPDFDMALFTSASTVRGLAACVPDGWDRSRVQAVCIGEQTARAAAGAGFANVTTASSATLEALVEAAVRAATADRSLIEEVH